MEDDDRDPLDDIADRFEVALLEEHVRDRPDDLEAVRRLAYAYSAAGRLEDALSMDRRLVALDPEHAELRYDLACTYALLGRLDDAFAALAKALALGFDDRDVLLTDPDLVSLRTDPRWEALVSRA